MGRQRTSGPLPWISYSRFGGLYANLSYSALPPSMADVWNYVNGRDVASCNQDGALFGRRVGWEDGRVQRVVIIASGGAQFALINVEAAS